MGVWILIDQGKFNKYKLQMGEKVYQVSSSDFQSFFETNINDIGLALSNVYERYYMLEMIDPQKDPDKWKFLKKHGKTFLGLKLQYKPVVKTIIVRSSGLLILTPSKEDFYDAGYYYTVLIEKEEPESNMEKEIVQTIQDGEVFFEVKYLRKVTENVSTSKNNNKPKRYNKAAYNNSIETDAD